MFNIFKKNKLFKYSILSGSLLNTYSEEKDLIEHPPIGKLIGYEMAKKFLLPNVYYQFKFWLLEDFFVGTTIGFDSKQYNYKYFAIGGGSLRLDLLNSIFDICLDKLKSDATEYKYGALYKDGNFKDLLQTSILTNFILTEAYIKFLFLKINIIEFNFGNILSVFSITLGSFAKTLKNNNANQFEKLQKIAINSFLVSIFAPSIHIDIMRFIDFIQ